MSSSSTTLANTEPPSTYSPRSLKLRVCSEGRWCAFIRRWARGSALTARLLATEKGAARRRTCSLKLRVRGGTAGHALSVRALAFLRYCIRVKCLTHDPWHNERGVLLGEARAPKAPAHQALAHVQMDAVPHGRAAIAGPASHARLSNKAKGTMVAYCLLFQCSHDRLGSARRHGYFHDHPHGGYVRYPHGARGTKGLLQLLRQAGHPAPRPYTPPQQFPQARKLNATTSNPLRGASTIECTRLGRSRSPTWPDPPAAASPPRRRTPQAGTPPGPAAPGCPAGPNLPQQQQPPSHACEPAAARHAVCLVPCSTCRGVRGACRRSPHVALPACSHGGHDP